MLFSMKRFKHFFWWAAWSSALYLRTLCWWCTAWARALLAGLGAWRRRQIDPVLVCAQPGCSTTPFVAKRQRRRLRLSIICIMGGLVWTKFFSKKWIYFHILIEFLFTGSIHIILYAIVSVFYLLLLFFENYNSLRFARHFSFVDKTRKPHLLELHLCAELLL